MDIEQVIEETREERWLNQEYDGEINEIQYFKGYLTQGQLRELVTCLLVGLKKDQEIMILSDERYLVSLGLITEGELRMLAVTVQLLDGRFLLELDQDPLTRKYYPDVNSILSLFRQYFIFLVIKFYNDTQRTCYLYGLRSEGANQLNDQAIENTESQLFDRLRELNRILLHVVKEHLGLDLAMIVRGYFLDRAEIEKRQILEIFFPYPANEIISQY